MVYSVLLFLSMTFSVCNTSVGSLNIEITNVESARGTIRMALYDRADVFPRRGKDMRSDALRVVDTGSVQYVLDSLSFGDYGLAVFHDENDNGKLDTNLFGIPVEPYAFSNNPVVKWRSPLFKEVVFPFREKNQQISVKLQRWSEF